MNEWYQEVYLRSEWWRKRRRRALERAKWCCEECGNGVGLDVHHLIYDRLYAEEDSDLQVLCRGCHVKAHTRGADDAIAWLRANRPVEEPGRPFRWECSVWLVCAVFLVVLALLIFGRR
jgi:5-methylcytosine-specific restriction endonuclease McrA